MPPLPALRTPLFVAVERFARSAPHPIACIERAEALAREIEPDREYKIRIVREGFEDHESTVRIPRDKKAWMASFTLKPSLRAGPAVPVPSAAPGATAPAPPTP